VDSGVHRLLFIAISGEPAVPANLSLVNDAMERHNKQSDRYQNRRDPPFAPQRTVGRHIRSPDNLTSVTSQRPAIETQ